MPSLTIFKVNTVLSIPLAFPRETFPAVDPKNFVMSIVPRNCKIVQKNTALPEFRCSGVPRNSRTPEIYRITIHIRLTTTSNLRNGESRAPGDTTKGAQYESLLLTICR